VLAFSDPRAKLLRRPEPRPLPPDVRFAGHVHEALSATLPSTVGVSIMATIALIVQPTITAFLGGVLVGLAVAGVLSVLRTDPSLYLDPRSGAVYRR
jgi:uncharacterized membrane protein